MKRQLSYQEYRSIDLALFAMMAVIFELIIVRVSRSVLFADQVYTVSLAGALVSIVYMRWGFWGALEAALFGFLDCAYSGAALNQYLIYIGGNLFSLPMVFFLQRLGYEKVRKGQYALLFPLGVILLMHLGRIVLAVLLGTELTTALGFFTTDSLSILFTLVIVWIARRLDGVYENQKHYLLRVHEEEKNNRVN